MKSAFFLGLCFQATLLLLCSTSEAKLRAGGLDKQLLQQFKFQPSELAKLPWFSGDFGSQAGSVRKLVADNSPILRSEDWSHEQWMKETLRRSRSRASRMGARHKTRKLASSHTRRLKALDPGFAASSTVFGKGFDTQEYYLVLEVGTPLQDTLLIMDTGSEMTWVECRPCTTCKSKLTFDPTQSTSYSVVSCSDDACKTLSGATPSCNATVDQCRFKITYGDNSATVGDVAREVVAIYPVSDGVSDGVLVQNFVLGCGAYTQPGREIGASGLMGLDRGHLSFPNQLTSKKFSYCLPDRFAKGASQGYIYFGDMPEQVNTTSGLKNWKRTPILSNPRTVDIGNLYYLGVTGLSVGDKLVDIPESAWSINTEKGTGGVVMDSGTGFQVLTPPIYGPLRTALQAQTVGLTLNNKAEAEWGIGPCYNVPDPSKLSLAVPSMTVHLQEGANWELPMDNYFVPMSPNRAVYCYGFASAGNTSPFSIFGNVFQQNFVIEHDLDEGMFSISDLTDCSLQM